ncbi:cystathionine beta-lyase [Pseudomonadota bacterium]
MKKKLAPGDQTKTTHLGRNPALFHGSVNPPVYHTSTVLFPTMADFEASYTRRAEFGQLRYGRFGTPTSFAFEEAIAELEGGHASITVPSGLAAATTAMLAFLSSGDHLLMTDSAYYPTRRYCENILSRLGIDTTYYDPLLGSNIEQLIQPNTRVIFLESPGSLTFEVQDVPAIAKVAKQHGIKVILDNTWATPLLFKSFQHGVDISIHAATKYIVGHADAMLGVMIANQESFKALQFCAHQCGLCVGSDDIYLGLRGLRTLAVRLAQHHQQAMSLIEWLSNRPEVARILYPALPSDPGYQIWQRDFLGASGLFGVVLNEFPKKAVANMLDGMSLFKMGASWGGFESLVIPAYPDKFRIAPRWQAEGPLLRLHAGLEDLADLITDLEQGFLRLNAAS